MDSWNGLYAQVLTQYHGQSQDVDKDAFVSPQYGVAAKLREVCQRIFEDVSSSSAASFDHPTDPSDVETARLERDTWALLSSLYALRTQVPEPQPTAQELLKQNPYTPPHVLIQKIAGANERLLELHAIQEWLEQSAPPPIGAEARDTYRVNTKRRIQQLNRIGRQPMQDTMNLTRELDPDAANRQPGSVLDPDDEAFERSLSKSLLSHIRAGKFGDALEMCEARGHPWQAAVMRGGFPFHWKGLSTSGEFDSDMQDGDDEVANSVTGNRRWKLWRETCLRASMSPTLPQTTKALYAALVPSARSLPALIPLLRTWEDHLWARTCVLLSERVNEELDGLMGSFWADRSSGKSSAKPVGTGASSRHRSGPSSVQEWENEVRKMLAEMENVKVEGADYRHALHFAQLHIISGRLDSLLTTFAESLRGGLKEQMPPTLYASTVRFYSHLCLFLRLLGQDIPLLPTDAIVDAYIEVLEAQGQGDLVALYVGALSQSAVNRYAAYLSHLPIDTEVHERRGALTRAREHGLDVDEVAIATAAAIAQQTLSILPLLSGPLPSPEQFTTEISREEASLIRSVEWLTYQHTTYANALTQSNGMLRYFLGTGKIPAARSLLEMLPTDIVRADSTYHTPEATEHLHFRRFFNIWDGFTLLPRIADVAGLEGFKKVEWLKIYRQAVEQLRESVVELLKQKWLASDDGLKVWDSRRLDELERIKQTYVPEIVLRLHYTLYDSREYIVENLHHAMNLSTIVADSRYDVFPSFISPYGNRLPEYLEGVRLVGVALLGVGRGSSQLFAGLTPSQGDEIESSRA